MKCIIVLATTITVLTLAAPSAFAQCGFDCGGTEDAPRCEFADPWAPPHPEYKCVLVVSPECTNPKMYGPCLYCAYDMCQSGSLRHRVNEHGTQIEVAGGSLDTGRQVGWVAARLRATLSVSDAIAFEESIDTETNALQGSARTARIVEMYDEKVRGSARSAKSRGDTMSTRGSKQHAQLAARMTSHGIDISNTRRSARSGHHSEPQKYANRRYARKLNPLCVDVAMERAKAYAR